MYTLNLANVLFRNRILKTYQLNETLSMKLEFKNFKMSAVIKLN